MRISAPNQAAAHFAEGPHAQAFLGRALEPLQLAAVEMKKRSTTPSACTISWRRGR